jgi:hypothetical protein
MSHFMMHLAGHCRGEGSRFGFTIKGGSILTAAWLLIYGRTWRRLQRSFSAVEVILCMILLVVVCTGSLDIPTAPTRLCRVSRQILSWTLPRSRYRFTTPEGGKSMQRISPPELAVWSGDYYFTFTYLTWLQHRSGGADAPCIQAAATVSGVHSR